MTVQRRQFNEDEVQLLAGRRGQAAIALENAPLSPSASGAWTS